MQLIFERQLNFAPPSHHRVGIATEDSCQLMEDRRETEIGSDWDVLILRPLSELFLCMKERMCLLWEAFLVNSIPQTFPHFLNWGMLRKAWIKPGIVFDYADLPVVFLDFEVFERWCVWEEWDVRLLLQVNFFRFVIQIGT